MPRVWSARIAQRAVGRVVRVVALARQLLAELDQRHELVGLEDRRHALLDHRHAVEAEAGVDVLRRQRRERRPTGSWSNCMKTRFQYSRKRSFSPPGRSSSVPQVQAAVEVELRARAARTGRPGLPEVLRARAAATMRSRGTPIATHASIASSSGPRPSSSSPSKTVTQMSSGSKPKPSSGQLPGELDRALLEVVADREVAEHLEERQVPRGDARPPRCRACGSTSGTRSAGCAAAARGPGSTA